MTVPSPLAPERLFTRCDPGGLGFASTAELSDGEQVVGQERAIEALKFGLAMRRKGYNLFALGPEGTGKVSLVKRFVAAAAADRPAAADWCYVNNFDEPHKPRALSLPPGRARRLAEDMDQLVDDLRQAIPAAFESDEYRNRRQVIEEQFKERHEAAFGGLQKRAAERNVALVRTPVGLGIAPTKGGEVLSPDDFKALSENERDQRKADMEGIQQELETLLREAPRWEKEQRQRIKDLIRDVAKFAIGHSIEELGKDYQDLPQVLDYLKKVEDDVAANVDDFMPGETQPGESGGGLMGKPAESRAGVFRRYRVNVLVAAEAEAPSGAPMVVEDHPIQPNLVGRIEHIAQYGALVTDFTLIKAGALHRANGGYLILDARKLLMQPFAWEALKRALESGDIRIESPGESYGLISTVSLQPEPIPLDVKVVLIGDPYLYYLLGHYDPDFADLFKVAVDFDNRMDRTAGTALQYGRLIGTVVRKEGLRHLDGGAVARIIEHGARLADDAEKLTTHMRSIVDLVREADHFAVAAGAEIIRAEDVQRAIDAKLYRSDRIRARLLEEMTRGTIVVETSGAKVGEINGLAVYQLDSHAFGRPSRISCRVRMGKGEVVDIEREVALSGPLHSKGVMILASYLGTKYAETTPLSLAATLVFEQSYGPIDGDSASSTELYALLSALSGQPIKQSLAVTGSVDQNGRVQAIGGVNEKIEGFFDLCQARGLDGGHGVLIPAANVKHLMLRDDVVEAAAQGLFHIYPVETVDQGIELLTGVAAGAFDDKNGYPIGSINRAVANRLATFFRKARDAAGGDKGSRNGRRNGE